MGHSNQFTRKSVWVTILFKFMINLIHKLWANPQVGPHLTPEFDYVHLGIGQNSNVSSLSVFLYQLEVYYVDSSKMVGNFLEV